MKLHTPYAVHIYACKLIHLSYDDCLVDKRENLAEPFCAVLCNIILCTTICTDVTVI